MKPALFSLLLLCLPLLSSPVRAQPQNMGKTTCGSPFDCSQLGGSDGNYSSEKIVAMANSCVKGSFGIFKTDSLFDTPYSLSPGQCLTPLVSQRILTGGALTPHCCIVETENSQCVLACTMDFDQ